MKFRPVRELLADAMADVIEIQDRQQLEELVGTPMEVKPYCYDARIGWDTYLVVVGGCAVGYTDGPLP
jgi:hypothetical protein